VHVHEAKGRAYVDLVKGGRVKAIAVTTTAFARNARRLKGAMAQVLAARADNHPRRFVPARAQADGRMLGRAIAGSGDSATNQRLALYCSLNL
jgi:hypothetical protein